MGLERYGEEREGQRENCLSKGMRWRKRKADGKIKDGNCVHSRTHTHTNTYKPHKAKDRSRLRFWINVHVVNPLRVSQVLDGSHPTGRGAHCYRILLQNQHTLPGSLFTSLSLSLPLSPSLPPSLLGGDEDHDFDIQRNMGTILIARRLDAARRSNYNLTVSVTDGHHTATTQVHTRTTTLTHTHTYTRTQEFAAAFIKVRKTVSFGRATSTPIHFHRAPSASVTDLVLLHPPGLHPCNRHEPAPPRLPEVAVRGEARCRSRD